MSDGKEVKRWWLRQNYRRNVWFASASEAYPRRDSDLKVMPVTEHETVVAGLKAENERLKRALVDIANKNTCWRLYQIDKYKSYEDGWEGVAEFAGKVLNELETVEQGEGA